MPSDFHPSQISIVLFFSQYLKISSFVIWTQFLFCLHKLEEMHNCLSSNQSVSTSEELWMVRREELLLPGTLDIHRTWELQTVKLSRMLPGWTASIMMTFVAEWVLVQIQTRLDNSSWFFNSFCCSCIGKAKKMNVWNEMCAYLHGCAITLKDTTIPSSLPDYLEGWEYNHLSTIISRRKTSS